MFTLFLRSQRYDGLKLHNKTKMVLLKYVAKVNSIV